MKVEIGQNTSQKRIIGELKPERKIFVKRVWASRHLFRKLDAWGIDSHFFNETLLPNNYKIIVLDKENNERYETDAITFHRFGTYLHFKRGTDHYTQIFLPRKYWRKENRETQELNLLLEATK